MSTPLYYREKLLKLFNTMFIDTGDAKRRLINSAKQIEDAYFASLFDGIPKEVKDRWKKVYAELTVIPGWYDSKGRLRVNSVDYSTSGKWNSSMEKYLLFFLEEFYRVLRKEKD